MNERQDIYDSIRSHRVYLLLQMLGSMTDDKLDKLVDEVNDGEFTVEISYEDFEEDFDKYEFGEDDDDDVNFDSEIDLED